MLTARQHDTYDDPMTTTHVAAWTDETVIETSEIFTRVDELAGTDDHDEQAEYHDLSIVAMYLLTAYGAPRWHQITLVRADRFYDWLDDQREKFERDEVDVCEAPPSLRHAATAYAEDLEHSFSRTFDVMGVSYYGPKA